MSDVRGTDNTNSEIVERAVTPKTDALVIRPVNTEAPTGLCVRDVVDEPPTPESLAKCEAVSTPVRMECFPFRCSPFVTMHRGSSGRRSRCKCCVF